MGRGDIGLPLPPPPLSQSTFLMTGCFRSLGKPGSCLPPFSNAINPQVPSPCQCQSWLSMYSSPTLSTPKSSPQSPPAWGSWVGELWLPSPGQAGTLRADGQRHRGDSFKMAPGKKLTARPNWRGDCSPRREGTALVLLHGPGASPGSPQVPPADGSAPLCALGPVLL